jgi:hypothetical protein
MRNSIPFTVIGRSDHRESWFKQPRDSGASAVLGVAPQKSAPRLYPDKSACVEDDRQ